MKALVYTGPQSLEIRDAEMPVPSDGQALVKVDAVGICGSDMHAWLGHDERRPAPLILGHEAAGIVVEGSQPGRRVTINPLVGCGECRDCKSGRNNLCPKRVIISMPPREGAFAEYVAIAEANMVTVPDDISFEKAAMAEPLACGWHAVRLAKQTIGNDLSSTRSLVLGGGAIGLGSALALAAMGAGEIVVGEVNPLRREPLASFGPFKVFDPSSENLTGFDVVVDAVGIAPTRAYASAAARPGGVITHIGLGSAEGGLDIRRMTLQEITFIGTYTYTPQDFRDTAQAIFDGSLGPLDWMDIRPLEDGADAFRQIHNGGIAAPKVVLKP